MKMTCDECGSRLGPGEPYINMTVQGEEFTVCSRCIRSAHKELRAIAIPTEPVNATYGTAPATEPEDIN